jgi:hypothetical protein
MPSSARSSVWKSTVYVGDPLLFCSSPARLHPADLEEIREGECGPSCCLYSFEYRGNTLSTADTESNEGRGEISPFKFVEGSTE